jgi:hypothetical protein
VESLDEKERLRSDLAARSNLVGGERKMAQALDGVRVLI